MQLRAFVKAASFFFDESRKTLTIAFSARNEFHFKQVLTKTDEAQKTLSKLTNDEYTLIVIGPDGQQHRSQSKEV